MNEDAQILKVDGMICEGCVATVRSILSKSEGISLLGVEKGAARIRAGASAEQVRQARLRLERAGYRVEVIDAAASAAGGAL